VATRESRKGETRGRLGILRAKCPLGAPQPCRPSEESNVAAEAYCVKCKTKRQIKDAVQITMKNGRPATEGKCPECGTKMFKIGAAS
jgi:hypothetical protein